mgnify:CR=1 FL=1
MIEKQAKEIEMKQLSEQKKQAKDGKKIKISKAALALNSAEMGLEEKEREGGGQSIVGISSDQLYTNYGNSDDKKTLMNLNQQNESAAITMAKKAVNEFVRSNPEAVNKQ